METTYIECCGERYLASGMEAGHLQIKGTPGNALGAYLNGGHVEVIGNVQDAVGDTMNEGEIVVHGSAGDALGYAMRGGAIYVRDHAGYRAGIHMKAYKEKQPVIVIGGSAGSFLGEYQAGGTMIVLGLNDEKEIAGNFVGTGMHGGAIYLRSEVLPKNLPSQIETEKFDRHAPVEIEGYLARYAELFDVSLDCIYHSSYYKLKPNTKNPYQQLYTAN